MREQFAIANRAYLVAEDWTGEFPRTFAIHLYGGPVRLDASVEIRNFGRTPAIIRMIRVDQPMTQTETLNAFVYPEHHYTFRFHHDASIDPKTQIAIPITGIILYNDGFRNRTRHFHRIAVPHDEGIRFEIPEGSGNNEE